MTDALSPDERKLRALSLAERRANLKAQAARIERDRFVAGLLERGASPAQLARAMGKHWTRVYQIEREWPRRVERWDTIREKLEAEIKALGGR
jgi:hypothetical protein